MMVDLYMVKMFGERLSLKNSKRNIHQGDEERKYQLLFPLSNELVPFG